MAALISHSKGSLVTSAATRESVFERVGVRLAILSGILAVVCVGRVMNKPR